LRTHVSAIFSPMLSLRTLPRLLLFTSLLSGVHCAQDDESRSVALLTPVLPLKQQQIQPREKVIRGLLRSRQDLSCNPGYGLCPDLGQCCIIGEECCSGLRKSFHILLCYLSSCRGWLLRYRVCFQYTCHIKLPVLIVDL
jgi:hypothetical protein